MKILPAWHINDLLKHASTMAVCIDGEYMPVRPIDPPIPWRRVKAAWLVLTGKADAFIWGGGQ